MKQQPHNKPLKSPQDKQRWRVNAGTWVIPTVGLLVGDCEGDKGTALHWLGAALPMVPHCQIHL